MDPRKLHFRTALGDIEMYIYDRSDDLRDVSYTVWHACVFSVSTKI